MYLLYYEMHVYLNLLNTADSMNTERIKVFHAIIFNFHCSKSSKNKLWYITGIIYINIQTPSAVKHWIFKSSIKIKYLCMKKYIDQNVFYTKYI